MKITTKQKEKASLEDIELFICLKHSLVKIHKESKEITRDRELNIITEPNGLVLDKNRTPLYWELRKRGDELFKRAREINTTLSKMKTLTTLHHKLVREQCGYGYEGFESIPHRNLCVAENLRSLLEGV